jgi:hypothetical protein
MWIFMIFSPSRRSQPHHARSAVGGDLQVVENTADGKVRVRGKAWPTGQPEPAAWTIDKIDPIGNHQGAPGLFAAAQFGAYFDNLQITPNR